MPKRVVSVAAFTMNLVVLCAGTAIAQPSLGAARIAVGLTKPYLDEPTQTTRAASFLIPIGRGFGIEPEFVFSDGPRFRMWSLIPSISYGFGGQISTSVFYVIGGVGYFRELDKLIDYRRPALAWNGGVGFRVHVTRRLFVAPDLRLGHITRFTVGGGYWF